MTFGGVDLESELRRLIGVELSSVTFVRDYVQIHFEEVALTAFNPITVTTNTSWRSGSAGFRDALIERINGRLVAVAVSTEALALDLHDGARIEVSLREADYVGPEALTFVSAEGRIFVA